MNFFSVQQTTFKKHFFSTFKGSLIYFIKYLNIFYQVWEFQPDLFDAFFTLAVIILPLLFGLLSW